MTGILQKLRYLLCVCVCIYLLYVGKHCAAALFRKIHSWYLHYLFVTVEEAPLFIIIWLFTIAHAVISEMDGSSGYCGESPSMTLYTLPVHTEPQTMLPALSCSAVIHWHGVHPGMLYICSWNVLLVGITVKANIIVSKRTVHWAAVCCSLTPCRFMRSKEVSCFHQSRDKIRFPQLCSALILGYEIVAHH